jgi:glycine dehydrogenase subunit 1
VADYLPHTAEEIDEMLSFVGLDSIDELFAHIPAAVQVAGGLAIPQGMAEPDVSAWLEELAAANRELVCFAGAGAYDHEVPAVVRALAMRSEFVTAYTPYQPEVAQGVLQAIFEYQTVVSRICGMPVANASLYDGASSLVEAVNLTVASSGSSKVLVSRGVHPHWRAVLRTFAVGTGHEIIEVDLQDGQSQWPTDLSGVGTIVVAYPNVLGCLEEIAALRPMANAVGAKLVVAIDPVLAGSVATAGSLGADVVIAEGQPFGTALSFGGPYLGIFATTHEEIRRLPGRLVGQTLDTEGRTAYVTTLRTREQDIRREKATSNVCTNQTLMAVAAAVQLGWLGTQGLAAIARNSIRAGRYAREQLLAISGIESATGSTPSLREFAINLPMDASTVIERVADDGYLAGISLGALTDGESGVIAGDPFKSLLIATTERRTRSQIDGLVASIAKAVA